MSAPPEPRIAIVDFGVGNLFSVRQACIASGLAAEITDDRHVVESADAVILPGVGAFGDAMENLSRLDLIAPLRDVPARGRLLIGICLGLQLLMEESEEFGCHKGLGLVRGCVRRLPAVAGGEKIPRIGWNRLHTTNSWDDTLLSGLADGVWMYFVHSYFVDPVDPEVVRAETEYANVTYCSALRTGSIHAFQFHPERSAAAGLSVYSNLRQMICDTVAKAG